MIFCCVKREIEIEVISILVENQIIKTKWINKTKKWYENKGYIFTKNFDDLYVKAEDLTLGSVERVKCQCDYCGKITEITFQGYVTSTHNGERKYACRDCNREKGLEYGHKENKKRYFNEFAKMCEEKGYTPISTDEDYKGTKEKLRYLCPKHGIQEVSRSTLIKGCECPHCAAEKSWEKRKFSETELIKIVESKNNSKLLNPNEYIGAKTNNLKIQCGSCGNIFYTSLTTYRRGHGTCEKCSYDILRKNRYNKNAPVKFEKINEICKECGYILLTKPEEYKGVHTKIHYICPHHGEQIQDLDNFIHGKRCPECHEKSHAETYIANFLNKYNIPYYHGYSFKDCRDSLPLPFDFYLPNYNLCIEYDGEQHYKVVMWSKSITKEDAKERLKLIQKHDKIKNEYCTNNNIGLIRIPYWDNGNIDKILIEKLGLQENIINKNTTKIA